MMAQVEIIAESLSRDRLKRMIMTKEKRIYGFYRQFRWKVGKEWLTYDSFSLPRKVLDDVAKVC